VIPGSSRAIICWPMSDQDRLELEAATGIRPVVDRRRTIDEPPPVQLCAIDDVVLDAKSELLPLLDEFYVVMLQFEPENYTNQVVYRAENFNLIFRLHQGAPQRDHYRFVQIAVLSLAET